jgi:exonuclease III
VRKALYLVACFFIFVSCSKDTPNTPTQSLKPNNTNEYLITTFNIKWFGIGGTMWNTPDQEFRADHLRQFIQQELKTSDFITFTEVVSTEALTTMLKGLFKCVSYKGSWSRHQHVAICFDPKKYRAEKYDNDYVIQDVDLGSGGLRPAVQSKICHLNGKCFLQILGVHLAAGRKTEKRLRQIRELRDELLTHTETLPTVLLGDFNSYRKERNGLEKDDIQYIEETLHQTDYKLSSVTKGIPTYGSGEYGRDYDHIMITPDITATQVYAYSACSKKPDVNSTHIPYYSFRKYFSDHCPVTARIQISDPK